jgi:hypothetical protein
MPLDLDLPEIQYLTPLHDEPVLVKLSSGDELVTWMYTLAEGNIDNTDIVVFYRPIQMMVQYSTSGKITTFFKKWLLFAADDKVALWTHDILTVVRLKQQVAHDYQVQAERLYTEDEIPDPRSEEELAEAAEKSRKDAYDALLQSIPIDEKKLN